MIYEGISGNRRVSAKLVAVFLILASAVFVRAQSWQASEDYSSVQGHNNWRYMTFQESDSAHVPMVRGLTYDGEAWIGVNEFGYDGSDIHASTLHPPGPGAAAARVWESPLAGTVRVTGVVAKYDPRGGDGVYVTIWKNGALLWDAAIDFNDVNGYSFDLSVDVLPGDWLDFRVHPRTTSIYDRTNFDPRITVTSLAGSSGGSWIANVLGSQSTYVSGLELSLFEGQNDHARSARRMNLAHELQVASNRVASGETNAAVNLLLIVIVRLQGVSPPDWMFDSPDKTALRDDIWVLISLLRSP